MDFSQLNNFQCRIIIKDNKKSNDLKKICFKHDVIYCDSEQTMGFGANNNYAVKFIADNYSINDNDYFLFLNPDILFSLEQLHELLMVLDENKPAACTIDLFKDEEFKQRDFFIRRFPTAIDFFSSYLLGKNSTIINRDNIKNPIVIDWCAGSFMVIRADVFMSLNGFDEKYFMYCEDLDICFRMKLSGYTMTYFPGVYAVHYAQHANRKIFSKPFYWHVKSAARFLFKSYRYKDAATYNNSTSSLLKKL
jgi:GT2 family glycosyltransferase